MLQVPAEVVAAREFPGFATDGEVSRQRAMLEDALLADGVPYDNLSFKVRRGCRSCCMERIPSPTPPLCPSHPFPQVLQYNPPYTLPWLRRNEVVIKVSYLTEAAPEDKAEDNSTFYTSPEAGD